MPDPVSLGDIISETTRLLTENTNFGVDGIAPRACEYYDNTIYIRFDEHNGFALEVSELDDSEYN